jgi:hypothetical protein
MDPDMNKYDLEHVTTEVSRPTLRYLRPTRVACA